MFRKAMADLLDLDGRKGDCNAKAGAACDVNCQNFGFFVVKKCVLGIQRYTYNKWKIPSDGLGKSMGKRLVNNELPFHVWKGSIKSFMIRRWGEEACVWQVGPRGPHTKLTQELRTILFDSSTQWDSSFEMIRTQIWHPFDVICWPFYYRNVGWMMIGSNPTSQHLSYDKLDCRKKQGYAIPTCAMSGCTWWG